MKLIDNANTRLLTKALDVYQLRQKATALNVANLDTPGYKRIEIHFEDKLREAMEDHRDEIPDPEMVQTGEAPVIEDEMMEMTDTQIRVQLVTKALRHKIQLIKTGINGINR